MANLNNEGKVLGRLTRDVKAFDNKDGSKKVLLTVAVRDSFKTQGEYKTQFINLQGFVRKEVNFDKSVYAYMHKGDLVHIGYEVRSNNYEKNGEMVYDQILFINQVSLEETKKAQEARKNGNVATMPENIAEEMNADEAPFA